MDKKRGKKTFTTEEVLKIISEDNYLTVGKSSSSSNSTTSQVIGEIELTLCLG